MFNSNASCLGLLSSSVFHSNKLHVFTMANLNREEKLSAEIARMNGSVGYDCVIVCTSTVKQEEFWQKRLEITAGQAARKGALILAVHEDWAPDGAGNGLGTLYAYTKAKAKAAAKGVDLDSEMKNGWAVAMFHTAGKGTRLAPLPGAENNNKPGVKLPSLLSLPGGDVSELTILEAVIRQTNSYAPQRKGRCSVFWGDQIFVPSAGTPLSGGHHADILACLGPMPTEEEWTAKGLQKYGLIAVNEAGEATQVEKVEFAQAQKLLASFGTVKCVGPSLGSFSMSAALLLAMLEEFASELAGKTAKFDSDPDFWMPLTLSAESYTSIMESKGVTPAVSGSHFGRMQGFKARFHATHPEAGMFGCIDVGQLAECYWWDYGQLALYQKNNMLAIRSDAEAKALHQFMRISDRQLGSTVPGGSVDSSSVVLGSRFASGSVKNSVCSSVSATSVELEDCLCINVTAKSIKAKGCILYNIVDDSDTGLEYEDGHVQVNVFMPNEPKLVMNSTVTTDGGKVFKTCLSNNPHSFQDVYKMNGSVDVNEAQAVANKAAQAVIAKVCPGLKLPSEMDPSKSLSNLSAATGSSPSYRNICSAGPLNCDLQ